MRRYIRIHAKDNVAVALTPLSKGEECVFGDLKVVLKEDVEQGHKFTLRDIAKDEDIIKYGTPIGHATEDVASGMHIHVHNIKTNLGEVLNYTYEPVRFEQPAGAERTFKGFLRKNGIGCTLQRTPRWMEAQGCGYCLRLRGSDAQQAVRMLRSGKIQFRKIYIQRTEGNVEEVEL